MKLIKSFIFILYLIFYVVVFADGQTTTQDTKTHDDVTASAQELSSVLVKLSPEGWVLYDEVTTFIPENLYEQINGRAEYYLSYDLIWMTFASFRKSSDNNFFVELSIFNLGNPTNAFGAFSGERLSGGPPINLGRDAYRSGENFFIWKGQYYIQLSTSDTASEIQNTGMELAGKITDYLHDSGLPVWGLQALPAKNLVPQSVQYFLVDALGYSFLRDTFTAKYYKDETEVSVFLSRQDSPDAGYTVITKFHEHVNKYGRGVEVLSSDSSEYLICDMGSYFDIIFQKGTLTAGVTGVKDKELAIGAAIDLWKQIQSE